MIYLYRPLYLLLKFLLLVSWPLLPESLQQWIRLRRASLERQQTFQNTYWFHASSGEIEYCKSVIRLLKEQNPNCQIAVTYSSPSAEKLFFNIRTYVDQFIPLPWDQPEALRPLIQYLNPKILIFSRTDLWPELIYQVQKHQIPMGVISFSPRFNWLRNRLTRHLLSAFTFISCLERKTQAQLSSLLPNLSVSADGDTRFDQVFYRLSQSPTVQLQVSAPVFVWGSTWPEDEAILLPTVRHFISRNIKVILCPHDVSPGNIQRLQQLLQRQGCTYQLFSTTLAPSNLGTAVTISVTSSVLILDQVGYLADIYRQATVAFVGGSFKSKVHSVMEPLCCGLPVLVGPYYQNNPEAVRYSDRFVLSVNTSEELIHSFEKALSLDHQQILSEMQQNQKASHRVLAIIQRMTLKT